MVVLGHFGRGSNRKDLRPNPILPSIPVLKSRNPCINVFQMLLKIWNMIFHAHYYIPHNRRIDFLNIRPSLLKLLRYRTFHNLVPLVNFYHSAITSNSLSPLIGRIGLSTCIHTKSAPFSRLTPTLFLPSSL